MKREFIGITDQALDVLAALGFDLELVHRAGRRRESANVGGVVAGRQQESGERGRGERDCATHGRVLGFVGKRVHKMS